MTYGIDRITGMPVLIYTSARPLRKLELSHPNLASPLEAGYQGAQHYLIEDLPMGFFSLQQPHESIVAEVRAQGRQALNYLRAHGHPHGGLAAHHIWWNGTSLLISGTGLPWVAIPSHETDEYVFSQLCDRLEELASRSAQSLNPLWQPLERHSETPHFAESDHVSVDSHLEDTETQDAETQNPEQEPVGELGEGLRMLSEPAEDPLERLDRIWQIPPKIQPSTPSPKPKTLHHWAYISILSGIACLALWFAVTQIPRGEPISKSTPKCCTVAFTLEKNGRPLPGLARVLVAQSPKLSSLKTGDILGTIPGTLDLPDAQPGDYVLLVQYPNYPDQWVTLVLPKQTQVTVRMDHPTP